MHGNLGPNVKTNECDVLIAVGMRFDDRVTGDLSTYARQAKVIHLDIDPIVKLGKCTGRCSCTWKLQAYTVVTYRADCCPKTYRMDRKLPAV